MVRIVVTPGREVEPRGGGVHLRVPRGGRVERVVVDADEARDHGVPGPVDLPRALGDGDIPVRAQALDAAVGDDHGLAGARGGPGPVHHLDPGDRDDRIAVLHELPGVFGEFVGRLGGGRRRKREERNSPHKPKGLPEREFGHLRLLAGAGTGERYPESGCPCENHWLP